MNNQTPKVLFDTLALNAGINVLYDPEYLTNGPKEKQTVNFTNTTVQEALDYLALLHQVLLEADQRQYHLRHHGQRQQAARLRRGSDADFLSDQHQLPMPISRRSSPPSAPWPTCSACSRLKRSSAIIAKGSADKMALAEKIIHDLDKPKSEVVVDIFVMEASSVYMRSLAAGPFSTGVNLAGNFTPRASIQVQQAATTQPLQHHHFHGYHLHHHTDHRHHAPPAAPPPARPFRSPPSGR